MPPKANKQPNKDSVFLFTGALSGMTRDVAHKKVEQAGWTYAKSFTKAVNILVSTTQKDTQKLDKAKEEGVEIWTEKKFLSELKKAGVDVDVEEKEEQKRGRSRTSRSKSKSKSPTKSPRKTPSKSPKKSPSKSPKKSPRKSPSKSPKKSPRKSPSKSPRKSSKSPVCTTAECNKACSNALLALENARNQVMICVECCPSCGRATTHVNQAMEVLKKCCKMPKTLQKGKTTRGGRGGGRGRGRGRAK